MNVSPFRNAGLSFVKTMVMTIGEFEYDSLFGHNCECTSLTTSFPEVGYTLWIVFLIIMPILLNNLLVREGWPTKIVIFIKYLNNYITII